MWALVDRRTGWVYRTWDTRPLLVPPFCEVVPVRGELPAAPGDGLCFDLRPGGTRRRWSVDRGRDPNRIVSYHRPTVASPVSDWTGCSVCVLTGAGRAVVVLLDPLDLPSSPLVLRDHEGRSARVAPDELARERVLPVALGGSVTVEAADVPVAVADGSRMASMETVEIGDAGIRLDVATPRGTALAAVGRASAAVAGLVEDGPRPSERRADRAIHASDAAAWLLRAAAREGVFVDLRRDGSLRPVVPRPGLYVLRSDVDERVIDVSGAAFVRPRAQRVWPEGTEPRRIGIETVDGTPLPVTWALHGVPPSERGA